LQALQRPVKLLILYTLKAYQHMYKVAMPLLLIKNILSDLFILHPLIAKKRGCLKEKQVQK